jgi:hypothetical protein
MKGVLKLYINNLLLYNVIKLKTLAIYSSSKVVQNNCRLYAVECAKSSCIFVTHS